MGEKVRQQVGFGHSFCNWILEEQQIAGLKLCGNYLGSFDRLVTREYSGRTNLVMTSVTMVVDPCEWLKNCFY